MPHPRPVQSTIALRKSAAIAFAAATLMAGPALAQSSAAEAGNEVPACTNFYAFANADWLAANPPAATPATAMLQLDARARTQQRELLDSAMQAPQGVLQTWLGDFWASGLDEAAIERAGAAPLLPLSTQIDKIDGLPDIAAVIAALHQAGIPVLFGFAADRDLRDRNAVIGYFSQGGLGLPDPAFYTRDDAPTLALLMRYRDYVGKILTLSGVPADELEARVQAVLDIEQRIALASRSLSLLRDDASRYAPVAVAGLDQQYPRLKLGEFLNAQGAGAATVSMVDPPLFAQLDAMIESLEPEHWRTYLRFHVGNAMAPYLSRPWRDAHFALHGAMLRGQVRPEPHAQQVFTAIERSAGPLLGRAYAARYLPAATAARAETIAVQVRDALARGIDSNTWMSPQARAEARTRLEGLTIAVGAPAPQVGDEALPALDRASFGSNVLAAAALRHRMQMQRLGRQDEPVWTVLPQQPALQYDLADNRLIVTTAMLQPPVLDMAQPPAAHYGALGALIGHELSHGFDAAGRRIDASGQPRDWWTAADSIAWDTNTARLGAQYVAFPIPSPPGMLFGSRNIAAESSADLAGVELAHAAFVAAQPAPDLAAQQAFYRAWARLWPQQLSQQQARARAGSAVHAPGYWRSNGPLLNQPAFAETYSCTADDPMVAAEDARVSIWR